MEKREEREAQNRKKREDKEGLRGMTGWAWWWRGAEFMLTAMFHQRETNERKEKTGSKKICFVVSMATADYYPKALFIMKACDFREGRRDRKIAKKRL